ncbi:MAG: hypothetical protein CL398_06205 [Acidiferrobacteraceae bacterium]|nr:hypothetical protein [Acidiferrobacteraceae bacterium]
MEFGGDTGLWQRKIAESKEGVARRLVTIEALTLLTGQSILDVGCGGGHLVKEIGLAVGETGKVVGVDSSPEQLESATLLCEGFPQIELVNGSATDLSIGSGSFDSVASIQVLDYVPDVDTAIGEMRRVLRPGGKVALISVLWDHWRFHGADPILNERIFEVWRDHCKHQMLPLEMPMKLSKVGFQGIVQKPIGFINSHMHSNAFAYFASKLVAAFAVSKGIAQEDALLWLRQLADADKSGDFGFVSMPVLTSAVAS